MTKKYNKTIININVNFNNRITQNKKLGGIMNFINKLEKRFGRFAVNNLTKYIIIAYAIGYILYFMNEDLYVLFTLQPDLVAKGQIWRLFTWFITIPQEFSLFLIFMFFLVYWIGSTLENQWGDFKYTLYIFSGWLFMTLGSMAIYFITGSINGFELAIRIEPSTYYINMASFLAFATLFPDMQLMLMMIIPVKIKYLAIVDVIFLGYEFLTAHGYTEYKNTVEYALLSPQLQNIINSYIWSIRITIILSVLNFILFYFATRKFRRYSPQNIKRRTTYQKKVKETRPEPLKCAVCGKTKEEYPELDFRYCSKCKGNYVYCQDHLFTHEHIQ